MKTEIKHTPGPWQYLYGSVYTMDQIRVAQRGVTAGDGDIIPPTEKDANMRLIAAAPDMLEALEQITNVADFPLNDKLGNLANLKACKAWAKAAIKKAKGET